jgi:hypothetical protein
MTSTDSVKRSRLTAGIISANGARECERSGESSIPPVGNNRLEAAYRISAHCLKAREIEAVAMSSPHGDPTAQHTRPRSRSARRGMIERWTAMIRRGLGVGP